MKSEIITDELMTQWVERHIWLMLIPKDLSGNGRRGQRSRESQSRGTGPNNAGASWEKVGLGERTGINAEKEDASVSGDQDVT